GNHEVSGYVIARPPLAHDPEPARDQGGQVLALGELSHGQGIDVEADGRWQPASPVTATLEDVAVGPGEQLCLDTHIWDNDTDTLELNGDDDFGHDTLMISWDEGWPGTHVLQARGGGDRAVDVYVRLDLHD
ncbi:MAG: hypothetical protein RIF41_37275, partial [Polyangiaceae bacterium]